MDSYYGGLNLAIDLAEKGFQFVMTCKSDRPSFLFKNFLQLKLKKGMYRQVAEQKHSIVATSFSDTKICNFLSNVYGAGKSLETKRDRPLVVQKYNDFKGGLDVADGNANRYLSAHRQRRWTKKALLFLIKASLSNSWIIYNHLKDNTCAQKTFIIDIVTEIKNKHCRNHCKK